MEREVLLQGPSRGGLTSGKACAYDRNCIANGASGYRGEEITNILLFATGGALLSFMMFMNWIELSREASRHITQFYLSTQMFANSVCGSDAHAVPPSHSS